MDLQRILDALLVADARLGAGQGAPKADIDLIRKAAAEVEAEQALARIAKQQEPEAKAIEILRWAFADDYEPADVDWLSAFLSRFADEMRAEHVGWLVVLRKARDALSCPQGDRANFLALQVVLEIDAILAAHPATGKEPDHV